MPSITSSNAVYMLAIAGIYDQGVQLQGFAADDVFTSAAETPVEVLMGVDGILSGGFTPTPKVQTISLQADSLSSDIFDYWQESQIANNDVLIANAIITLTSLRKSFQCTTGYLTGYTPMPDARRVLQPRRFTITWGRIFPAPL